MADDGAISTGSVMASGGSGSTGGVSPTGGRQSQVTTSSKGGAVATVCYGIAENTSSNFCVAYTEKTGPFSEANSDCIMTIPIPKGLHLDPTQLRLLFAVDSTGRLEIPFIGQKTSCPTTGTTGGWYATNVTTDGSSSIGLCGCTCIAAKKYPVTVEIGCGGV